MNKLFKLMLLGIVILSSIYSASEQIDMSLLDLYIKTKLVANCDLQKTEEGNR